MPDVPSPLPLPTKPASSESSDPAAQASAEHLNPSDPDSAGMRFYGPRPAWQLIDVAELWRYRELVLAYGYRDLAVRYRQTAVGVLWALLQPLGTVVVFGVLIHWLRGNASDGTLPYAVTSLCGMVPWQFFAATVSGATLSIALNAPLIKKVYFPRVILPLSAFIPASVDFVIAAGLLLTVMLWYGIVPGWSILLMPLLLVATLIVSAAISLWLSALNGIYRDVQFAVPFALQLGMIISPVVYETEAVVPEQWQPLYYLNPLAGLIQCYRAVLLGSPFPSLTSLAISSVGVTVLLVGGAVYFRRMERHFADIA